MESNLHVRISEELKNSAFSYAEKMGLTFSDIVRKSLSDYLFSHDGYNAKSARRRF